MLTFIGMLAVALFVQNSLFSIGRVLEAYRLNEPDYLRVFAERRVVVGLHRFAWEYPVLMWELAKRLPIYGAIWAASYILMAVVVGPWTAIIAFFMNILTEFGMSVKEQ
jgi:hypothetical protein